MRPIPFALAAAAVAALAGCAAPLNRGPEMPTAAVGTVKFERVADENTAIELHVRHLPEPDQLSQPGYAYVAWVQSAPEDAPHNIGALNIGADLDGALRTVTPLKHFELFVTVEATSDAVEPTGERVLWASRD